MKQPGLVILIVFLAVAAVLVAKHLTSTPPQPPSALPAVPAHAPQPEEPAPQTPAPSPGPAAPQQPPPASAPESAPRQRVEPAPPPDRSESKPPAPTTQPEAPVPTDLTPPASTPEAPAQPQPEAPPQPISVEPLSGSQLAECLQNGRPTMADFGAGWCRACKDMEPILAEAAAKYAGRADIVYVDTDDYSAIAKQYGIRLIPAQIFFDSHGKEAFRNIGLFPIEKIDQQFAQLGLQQ